MMKVDTFEKYGTIRLKVFNLEMDCALGKYPNKALLNQHKYESLKMLASPNRI